MTNISKKLQTVVNFRSTFEETIATQLDELGIYWEFEEVTIAYLEPVSNAICIDCGSKQVVKDRKYLTDFYLPDYDMYIEPKGKLDVAGRKKFQAIKRQYPDLDLRFVFQYDNWLTKKHGARYSQWAKRNNYLFSINKISEEWFE